MFGSTYASYSATNGLARAYSPYVHVYGNDPLRSEYFYGDSSHDIYFTGGHSSEFTIYLENDDSLTVYDDLFAGSVDVLVGMERIQYDNGTLALDVDGNAGQAYRLYQAAFNRTPDNDGLIHWTHSLDYGSANLTSAAASFIHSNEFISTYGTQYTVSNGEFVDLLYFNVLGRLGEDSGYFYWKHQLDIGAKGRDDVLVDFSESIENQANVIGAIQDGIWLDGYVAV